VKKSLKAMIVSFFSVCSDSSLQIQNKIATFNYYSHRGLNLFIF
jgi:hypothetical protein